MSLEEILLGDEAVARAAVDAGISAAYAYPGTPSTEIFQAIEDQVKAQGLAVRGLWSTNEKVAVEEGAGVARCWSVKLTRRVVATKG